MVKLLKKYQIRSAPFQASKNWALSNTNNQNLWLCEDTPDEVPVALEFLDFGDGSELPVANGFCDIALEQQDDDKATVREGVKTTGPVFPTTEPTNTDGTFKRTVYSQVRTMFYNAYRNPTQIWGIENIDFELSQTKLLLANRFRLLTIPQIVYGDKIVPNSVVILDENLDNLYYILDDGNGNLFAQKNLFSKFQSVGEFTNSFAEGTSSFCDYYWADHGIIMESDSGSQNIQFVIGEIQDLSRTVEDSTAQSIGFVGGFNIDFPIFESDSQNLIFSTGSNSRTVFEQYVTGSGPDTSSVNIVFAIGTISDTTFPISSSDSTTAETASLNLIFSTGSNDTVVFPISASLSGQDTSSINLIFSTGSIQTTVSESLSPTESMALSMNFVAGTTN